MYCPTANHFVIPQCSLFGLSQTSVLTFEVNLTGLFSEGYMSAPAMVLENLKPYNEWTDLDIVTGAPVPAHIVCSNGGPSLVDNITSYSLIASFCVIDLYLPASIEFMFTEGNTPHKSDSAGVPLYGDVYAEITEQRAGYELDGTRVIDPAIVVAAPVRAGRRNVTAIRW